MLTRKRFFNFKIYNKYTLRSDSFLVNKLFYWTEELMNGIWETCKDVSFTQTNGKVIEDLMCDGNAGADCIVERFLNFNGGTDNGFSPYKVH